MNLGIQNKVALVTASSGGLGREVALLLAEEGARVIISSRSEERLKETAQYIKDQTEKDIGYFVCDLTDKHSRETLIHNVVETYHGIDILVNNTGGPHSGNYLSFHEKDWLEAFHLMFLSAQSLSSLVIPFMKNNQWGRIVNITSISAKQPIAGLALSNGIRAGLLGMAKTLSNEVAHHNILINTVCPGFTLTDRVKKLAHSLAEKNKTTPDTIIQDIEESIPMGRMGNPRELANLVVFLCSECCSYITGTAIQCDGGANKALF